MLHSTTSSYNLKQTALIDCCRAYDYCDGTENEIPPRLKR